jgi:DNA topoisomerase IA
VGDSVACRSARVVEKSTKPPKAFTDATLIRAMCNVAKFVADPGVLSFCVQKVPVQEALKAADAVRKLWIFKSLSA